MNTICTAVSRASDRRTVFGRFLCALRELTRANGLLLIVDEIQTGIGRPL